jgi:hypothetical protein
MKKKKPSFKTKEVSTGFNVWSKISSDHKLSKEHIGKKVWVAGEFSTKERILYKVHSKGSKFWPNGGYEILEVDRGVIRNYPIQKCRLHPKELKRTKVKS